MSAGLLLWLESSSEVDSLREMAESMLEYPPEIMQNQAAAAEVWLIARRLARHYLDNEVE